MIEPVEEATEALSHESPKKPARRMDLINLNVTRDDDSLAIVKRSRIKRTAKTLPRDIDSYSEGQGSCSSVTPSDSGHSFSDKPNSSDLLPEDPCLTFLNDSEPTELSAPPTLIDRLLEEPQHDQSAEPSNLNSYGDVCREGEKILDVLEIADLLVEDAEEIAESLDDYYDYGKALSLGNNAKLRIMIDFVHEENEEIYRVFQVYKGDLLGLHYRPPLLLILITNKSIYFLNLVHKSNLFSLDRKFDFRGIDHIITDVNYQSFILIPTNKSDKIEVFTGSETLTRNILESLDGICRKVRVPAPNTYTESSEKRVTMCKALSSFLTLEPHEINLTRMSLCYWQVRYSGDSLEHGNRTSTPITRVAEPEMNGMLMYQFGDTSGWTPGFFIAHDGQICCFSDKTKKRLIFFAFLLNNHCKVCRRMSCPDEVGRPYVIQLTLVVDNRLTTVLLAASSEAEVSRWMQTLLLSININVSDVEGRLSVDSSLEKFCYAIVTDDSLATVAKDVSGFAYNVLGYVHVSDITAVFCGTCEHSTNFCYLIVETEMPESSNFSAACSWIFYFTCETERRSFVQSLSVAWEKLFQVSLPINDVTEEVATTLSIDIVVCEDTVRRLNIWHANAAAISRE